MATTYLWGENRPVQAPVLLAQAVTRGDIVGLSSGNVVRAEDETWVTDLPTTQTNFAARFLGVSRQSKTATQTQPYGNSAAVVVANADGVHEFDCASASWSVGDLFGPAKQAGNALESQKVVAVGAEAQAIGRVVEAGTSVTRVKGRILSVKATAARQS